MIRVRSVLFAALALALAGCSSGGSGPKPVKVRGTVNLDGHPMSTGRVTFEGSVPGAPVLEVKDMDVKDGVFEGVASPGKKTVRITMNKKVPPPKGMTGPEYENVQVNVIPARYNSESKQTVEVTEGGPNEFTFEVKSK